MRLKDSIRIRRVAGEYILADLSASTVNLNKVFCLNGSAAWLLDQVKDRIFSESEMTALLCGEYDVDEKTASDDVGNLVKLLHGYGLLTDD